MNTVLTSIYELSAESIEPFFHSLRLSGCDDEVVVVATKIAGDCRARMTHYGARVIDAEYRGLPMAYAGLARRAWLALKAVRGYYWNHPWGEQDFSWLFVNCWRFFCFKNYLSSVDPKPESVLLADIRDVVFQSNPFRFPFPPGLSVASETIRRTIKQSNGNRKWLWESVGLREMCRIADCNVVCAGTTLADYQTMMKYLELMTLHIKRRFFWGLFDSIDQGLHNYFVHNRLVTPLHCYTNWHGPFLTMDSEIVGPQNKNRDGYLCNEDGSVIPVVHQYDRIKNLYRAGETRPACWKFYRSRTP